MYIYVYVYMERERGLGSIRTCIASLWTVPPRKTDNGRDKSVTLERIFGENGPLLFFSSSRPFKRTFFNRNGMGETNVCYDIFLHFSTTCFFSFSWITLLSDVLFIFMYICIYWKHYFTRVSRLKISFKSFAKQSIVFRNTKGKIITLSCLRLSKLRRHTEENSMDRLKNDKAEKIEFSVVLKALRA